MTLPFTTCTGRDRGKAYGVGQQAALHLEFEEKAGDAARCSGLLFCRSAKIPAVCRITRIVEDHLLQVSKSLIEFAARAVEFAAALVIGLAALQATVKAIVLFFRRDATPQEKTRCGSPWRAGWLWHWSSSLPPIS